jgi:uncharacterized membrane protein
MRTKTRFLLLFLLIVCMSAILLTRPISAQEEKVDLTLQLVPGWYRYEATAGEENLFFLEVRNTGSKAITNIRLSSDKPEGWIVEFEPARIDYLSPGSLQTVDVNIKPAGKTTKGDYRVTLIAEANEIRKVESIWVEVKAASFWLWIGVGITLVLVAGFIIIFMRLNKRPKEDSK